MCAKKYNYTGQYKKIYKSTGNIDSDMTVNTSIYIFASIFIVSLISLIGVFTLAVKTKKLESMLIFMVSFSVGALFGDAFLHLTPEAFKGSASSALIGLYIISGIVFSLIVEKVIHWRHCHVPTSKDHPHPVAYMNLTFA